MLTKILIRRDTSVNWSSLNPVLDGGEIAFDTTQRLTKVGDGVTPWNGLDYLKGGTSPILETVLTTQDSYPNNYIEIQYGSSGLVSRVDQWNNSAKNIHIFSKVYTYDQNDRVISEVVNRLTSGSKLTKTVTYNSSNQITNVTRKYEG